MTKHTVGYSANDWTVDDAMANVVELLRERGDLTEGQTYEITDETTDAHTANNELAIVVRIDD
jgi:hypothetical protein